MKQRARPERYSVLALDFDGVISINQSLRGPPLSAVERLQRDRVARLNRVVEATDCRVVVSSAWRWNPRLRVGANARQLTRWLRAAGFEHDVADITPAFSDEDWAEDIMRHRGDEILTWCRAQPVPPRALAVLDDLPLQGAVAPVLVQTDERVGLADADVDRVVALLTARRPAKPWAPARRRRATVA